MSRSKARNIGGQLLLPGLSYEEQLAWVAGVFDGEGTIYLSKNSEGWLFAVSVCNTDPRMVIRVRDILGKGCLMGRIKKDRSLPLYTWKASSRQAEQVLVVLLPYLVVKREEALVALEMRQTVMRSLKNRSRGIREDVERQRQELRTKLQVLKRTRLSLEDVEGTAS